MNIYKITAKRIAEDFELLKGLQLYILILFVISLCYLIRWPVEAMDTDLWYHLSGGRYIFQNQSLPHNSFFSFISPVRNWIDYYWLFQVLVYKIYSFFDYYGLIFLRVVVYLATIYLIKNFLFTKARDDRSHIYLTVVVVLYMIFLLPRFQLIRPHAFSYFFIAAFLYFLEFPSKKVMALPILAALWSNLHGIEYPVMLLIIFSFVLDFFISHLRKKEHIQKVELYYIIPMVLSLGAVYFTPHGSALLGVPFISTEYASQYIVELGNIKLVDLLTFQAPMFCPTFPTMVNFFLILAGISLGISISKGQIRVSHLLLFAGGIFLLTKGSRFVYEFALLSLPLFRAHPIPLSLTGLTKKRKWIWGFLLAFILFSPILCFKNYLGNQPKYPLSPKALPEGIVTFLERIPAQGYIMNHPNTGGYLQWMLYPKYKIFMDMEVPFLFKDEDMFMASNAFSDEKILRKILLNYDPAFIMVPIVKKGFKGVIKKFPDYVMVFFDQVGVLYINKRHYPDLGLEYELKNVDPYEIIGRNIQEIMNKKDKDSLLKDLFKTVKIYPDCLITNQILAKIFNNEGEYRKAIPHAEAIIRNFPETPTGYLLKGDALKGLKSYAQAICFYEKALQRSDGGDKQNVYKQMGYGYVGQKQYGKAYRFLKKGINIFSPETTSRDLFDLGSAALLSGKVDEAAFFLRLANKKVPPEDIKSKERIQQQLSRLGVPEEDY
jgi:tetratricopeptide (TPR) repeat protein